jgi:uncharacterized protein (TIGR00730 family)
MEKKPHSICVYCGSSSGKGGAYLAAAHELGRTMAEQDIGLVYGGASIGVMGAVADAVLASGGEVIGVIPEVLARKEFAHYGLTDLKIVKSMHERKSLMEELSQGFIALPGGLGTLEELFEILTWSQLGLHQKPIGLLNIQGYFDQLIGFINHSVEQQFVKAEQRNMLLVDSQAELLLEQMATYKAPTGEKWLSSSES